MKIYADPITINCRKVLAGLDLMKAPYELAHVDYFKGEQKGDAYMAINPNASIPAMVDGDLVLWESNAILQYAADKTGNEAVYPRDAAQRADLNRWLFWESASWFPACYPTWSRTVSSRCLVVRPMRRRCRPMKGSSTSLPPSSMRACRTATS